MNITLKQKLTIFIFISLPIFAQQWSKPICILNEGKDPTLAIDEKDNLHLLFTKQGPRNTDIYYLQFDSLGINFLTNLSNSKGESREPKLIIANQEKQRNILIISIYSDKCVMNNTDNK